jgi:hypothetical protein
VIPRPRWQETVEERARACASSASRLPGGPAVALSELDAAWVAPPRNGINGQPFDYDYVHLA